MLLVLFRFQPQLITVRLFTEKTLSSLQTNSNH